MGQPAAGGFFGNFGGRYVGEPLIGACQEVEEAFVDAWADPGFRAELQAMLEGYAGRPSPITECANLGADLGLRLLLKREDLNHTGSHKINNVVGQALLAKRMGKTKLIAETGAGQHGVATATAAALLGMACTVYMGEIDMERQALNVFRMRLLGADVVPALSGSRTLKDAVNEAMRAWVSEVGDTHYCLGSVMGPHPYPWMVRTFHEVIGIEARQQVLELTRASPMSCGLRWRRVERGRAVRRFRRRWLGPSDRGRAGGGSGRRTGGAGRGPRHEVLLHAGRGRADPGSGVDLGRARPTRA